MARVFDDVLLKREISRKEFLRYMLGLALVIFGVSNFLAALRRVILQQNKHTEIIPAETTHGFGASKFGR